MGLASGISALSGDGRNLLSRVLRGGSFNNNASNARCCYRNNWNPDNRNDNNGFRVVWVGHSPPGSKDPPEMQRGPRLARKLHCRGLEEKRDLFLAELTFILPLPLGEGRGEGGPGE